MMRSNRWLWTVDLFHINNFLLQGSPTVYSEDLKEQIKSYSPKQNNILPKLFI